MHHHANPFYQPAAAWQLLFDVPKNAVIALESAFDDEALSVASFEIDEDGVVWRTTILLEHPLAQEEITQRLQWLYEGTGAQAVCVEQTKLEMKDWVAEVQASFPPLTIGNFMVLGSHHHDVTPSPAATVLWMDAGAAFGTGEHATTSGCLLALDWAVKRFGFRNALDMGCGSAILGMAAAKRYHIPCLGVDIDPVSVHVARENIVRNQLSSRMMAVVGNGYACGQVRETGTYDLIFANILARPLVKFAPDLARHLSSGGIAILSGLLVKQEAMVLRAHRQQGLKLLKRFRQGHWSVLVMQG